MLRSIRQILNEEKDFSTVEMDNITTPFTVLMDNNNNNTNSSNGSLLIPAFLSSLNQEGFSWEFNWSFIVLLSMGLIFVTLIISAGVWWWCNRTHRLRRQHSSPLAVNDFIETTKIQEKRLSSSPIMNRSNKAPPVPPRPTAYTTVLGRVEYRSNL